MPNAVVRCRTYSSSSTNEPGSTSISMRSRAVSLPLACCFVRAAASASTTASWNLARRSAILPAVVKRSGWSVTLSTLSTGPAPMLEGAHKHLVVTLWHPSIGPGEREAGRDRGMPIAPGRA